MIEEAATAGTAAASSFEITVLEETNYFVSRRSLPRTPIRGLVSKSKIQNRQ